MNGLDRHSITVPGFRGGQVYRNEGGDGEPGWYYHIGSDATQGPFPSRQEAVDDARAKYGDTDD